MKKQRKKKNPNVKNNILGIELVGMLGDGNSNRK